ncbi:MAG: protein translocase subunit SecF [Chloroflexi bacterium]|nr:protein translocase subunit SecF [Chloroflexota bacterium]MCL5075019.1 protein translocase subunit SecF [Chloroflexota bacterium]
MLNIIGKRYLYFVISALIIVPGLVSLLIPPGLRLGIDFTGGTLWEIAFEHPVQPAQVKGIFANHDLTDTMVQTTGQNTVLIRSKEIPDGSDLKRALEADLRTNLGQFQELRFDSVGPTIGAEVAQRAIIAVAAASVGILLYITFAFYRVASPFRYGVCAIAALLHDAFVVLGIFSILGRFFNVEVDSLFVTALLTVIGFSVHDTIVVFDRIRENMGKRSGEAFEAVVNHSMVQTLGRSISTSLTVVFTLTALVLFGGVTTKTFTLALLIGIISGTYSSIFNASPLLVVWENREVGRFFIRLRSA